MPIVDDPYDFGRIAATNALSDLYAMGATPLFALALVAMPVRVLPADVIRAILAGGEAACRAAGIPIAGGHSIDSVEPIYGLAATGLVAPQALKRNSSGRAGDVLVLGKALGVGLYAAALKKGALDAAGYAAMVTTATRLNSAGPALALLPGVHAMTDVTGFGLLGHLLEMCRGAGLAARIHSSSLPLLEQARQLATDGCVTGASERNWASYGAAVDVDEPVDAALLALLTDPQTSGGLLVACAPEAAASVLAELARHGCSEATVVGELLPGTPRVRVTATA